MTASQEGRLRFDRAAWSKLVGYICSARYEVGGFGIIDEEGDDVVVRDVLLVAQYVNEVETTFDPGAVAELLISLTESGTSPERLRLWWHSHAEETPFWSVVDENTIHRLSDAGFVSLVGNHALRFLARRDTAQPRFSRWLWVEPPDGETVGPCLHADGKAEIDAYLTYRPYAGGPSR